MADEIGNLQAVIGADIKSFEAGMGQVIADLDKAANAATTAAGTVEKGAQRITDSQGRVRDGFGKFVNSATLAAEAAGNVGGSLGSLGDVAGRTGQTINQGLAGSFAAFDRAIKPLDAGIGRLGESLKGIGAGLTTYVTLPLGLAGGAALSAFGKIEALSKGLNALATQDVAKQGATGVEAIGLAAQATQARLVELQEIAKAPGIGFEQAVQGDIRLRAVGISAGQSAKILREFANAIALTGGGASELNSVTVQLGQLSAKGKVLAQDLRPIIEAAPAVSQALQKLYGTVDSETISKSLEKQGKSSQDFIAILTDELAKIPRVTGGFNNAVENALQGGQQNLARLGESINKSFNLEGLLDRVGSAFTKLTDYFTSLSPATQKFVLGAAAVVAAAGPIVFELGTITAAIPSVVAGLKVMGLASKAALGPLGIGVAAVAAAAALIITHWEELTAYFSSTGEGGQVFADLAESVSNAVGEISAAFGQLQTEGDGSFGGLVAATGILQALFRDVVVGIESIANVAGGTIGAIARLLTGDFVGAAKQAERALYGLVDPLAGIFGFTKQNDASFSDFFKDILPAAQQAGAGFDYFSDEVLKSDGAAKKHIVTLKELQAELREALQTRFNDAQAGRDTTADDANIARIRALIAEFKQVPGHADAASKAIAKLRRDLGSLDALDGLLGDTPTQLEVLERRRAALEAGLKSLVSAGVNPSSKAFQGFVQQANQAGQAMDKLLGAGGGLASKPIDLSLKLVTVGDALPDQVGKFSKELLARPLLVPFQLTPLKSDFSKDILDVTLDIQKGFLQASNSALAFGEKFNLAAARTDVLREAIAKLIKDGVSPTDPAFKLLVANYQASEKAALAFEIAAQRNQNAASAIKNAILGAATSIGGAFEAIASGTSNFGEALASGLLSSIGGLAIELGSILLASGLGIEALKVSLATFSGIGAIAAGLGLIAIGGLAKGAASKLAKSGSGSVSGPSTSYSSSASGAGGGGGVKIEVGELKLRGSELVAALTLTDYRNTRRN